MSRSSRTSQESQGFGEGPGTTGSLAPADPPAMAQPQRPRNGLEQLWDRQDAHSWFAASAAVLFGCTLAIDLVLDRPNLIAWVLWVLLAFCLTLAAIVLLMGRDFPRPVGLACVLIFAAASIYFLSPLGDAQSAVSSAQELPILALYLGWFVRRPYGRIIMLVITALLIVAIASNPLFWADGTFGVPTAVQAIVIALLCFEVGSMLWRRSERRITTDPLTGALTRAAFLTRLEQRRARALRRKMPLALLVIDFDGFKALNDTEGHAAGDAALAGTVARWRAALRTDDVIGRTGGDEFAILLEGTTGEGAQETARRLRAVSPHDWSWGVSQLRADDDIEAMFGRADERLYSHKRGAR